jgi:hypothetical protein
MDANRFDVMTKLFANRRLSRRQAVIGAAGAALTATAYTTGTAANAQDATPAVDDDSHGPEMLFVQSFQSGTINSPEGTDGRFTVILEHGLGQTIYFSDRPDRIVGASPTGQFLDGLGFTPDNPPNAALVVETAPGETDLAVVELFDPVYDSANATVTYEMAVLANWEDSSDLGFTEASTGLAEIASSFGTAHLFIDGCSNMDMVCFNLAGTRNTVGVIPSATYGGVCFSSTDNMCLPCRPWYPSYEDADAYWSGQCTARYPDKCGSEGCGWTFLP